MAWETFLDDYDLLLRAIWTYGPAVGATAALVVSGATLFFTRRFQKRQMSLGDLSATLTLLNEWRQPEFRAHRHHIRDGMGKKLDEEPGFSSRGYRGLDENDRKAVEGISFYFDYLGNIRASNHLNPDILFTVLGRSIVHHWQILKPLIEEERRLRKIPSADYPRYQAGFEHLAAQAKLFLEKKKGLRLLEFREPARSSGRSSRRPPSRARGDIQ